MAKINCLGKDRVHYNYYVIDSTNNQLPNVILCLGHIAMSALSRELEQENLSYFNMAKFKIISNLLDFTETV